MSKKKKLSSPFSTGGGGVHFEAHVQASFVALMLTGGHAPCLPLWPIKEIKLQGKIDGFETDDLVVVVEDEVSGGRSRLLGQVKYSVDITARSDVFAEVMKAAWSDFCNPTVFSRGKDALALITGPLSATDARNVQWLLSQAKHTKTVDEFLRNVNQAHFSPSKAAEKLAVFEHHLSVANQGNAVSKDELYAFLRHYHLLGYDLGGESGVVLSLLHSHIAQFERRYPQWAWSRVVDVVQTWNQNAGTITPSGIPKDLRDAFMQRAVAAIPEDFKASRSKSNVDWAQHPDATFLALASLIGSWNEKSTPDLEVISELLGLSYADWLKMAREILHLPESPLTVKDGIWKVVRRAELFSLLGSRILDQNLDTFHSLARAVLTERDPAFELPAEERYAARIQGKVLRCSQVLRESIADGLAMLGSQPEVCVNCSQGKAETTCSLVIREVLSDADWVLWGSLNGLLPSLAEAAPSEFLEAVEQAMRLVPCPFDELFSQEGKGLAGGNYLTGLLWALEGLAWDSQHLVRVCVALAELGSHDPGGRWLNRPSNSLTAILLPWLPQTVAPTEKRYVAVQTVLAEWPEIAWTLLISLLPGRQQTSSGSHKPRWRKTVPESWEKGVTNEEYWKQVSFYSQLAVESAGHDSVRLASLVDFFANLPRPAFDQLLQVLSSQEVAALPDVERAMLWERLTKLSLKHRRFAEAEWALPDELTAMIDGVAKNLAPTDPFALHRHLFSDRDFDLYELNGDWEEQSKKIEARREAAVANLLSIAGIDGVIRFADSVSSPNQVGHALGALTSSEIEQRLLPHFLDTADPKRKALVGAYIWRRHQLSGWQWCDSIARAHWTALQSGQFLAHLPFVKEAWDRAATWLGSSEAEYWTRTAANPFHENDALDIGVEKLIEYARPHAAVHCLERMLRGGKPIDGRQCVRALLDAASSSEPSHTMDGYHIIELIKYLQSEPSTSEDDLFKVEWAYVPLLDGHRGASPRLLERRLAEDPDFFCEAVRLIYRSKREDQPAKEHTDESRAIATNAWRLLREWKTPPGTESSGSFSETRFSDWLDKVKELSEASGHLEVALITVGEVLIHSPADPDGLWIHRAVARALNDREADDMRSGFATSIYNSRGVHWVDPTGAPERELAQQFRRKAEEVEDAGFQRFAVTLRNVAAGYDREADRIVSEHSRENDEEPE